MDSGRMSKRRTWLPCCINVTGAVAALCVAAATLPATAQTALEPATLRLDWLASGYHVPFFLALDRGYYRSQGIDLQIFDGKGSTTTIQVVASGTDTFGAANLTTMTLGVTRGMPLVAVAGLVQKSPDSVISLAAAGITAPKDMEGKRGGFVPTSASDRIFPAFAKAAGVDIDKIAKLQIESSVRYSILLQGNADFVIGWSFTDAYKINKQKPIAAPILFADHGVNVLSIGVVVSKDTLAKRAAVVRGFLKATMRGVAETIQSPEIAVDATMKARPTADRDALLVAANKLSAFVHTTASAALPLGAMAATDWDNSKHILVDYLGVSDAVATDSLYTNDYLPQADH